MNASCLARYTTVLKVWMSVFPKVCLVLGRPPLVLLWKNISCPTEFRAIRWMGTTFATAWTRIWASLTPTAKKTSVALLRWPDCSQTLGLSASPALFLHLPRSEYSVSASCSLHNIIAKKWFKKDKHSNWLRMSVTDPCLFKFKTLFFTGSWWSQKNPRQRRASLLRGFYPRAAWRVRGQGCERTLQEGSRWRN